MSNTAWRVDFPAYIERYKWTAHRYYQTHFLFVLRILSANGCSISYFTPEIGNESDPCRFWCKIGGRNVLFDISDYQEYVEPHVRAPDLVFKLHYRRAIHEKYTNVFPFSPISFYDWIQYESLKRQIQYHGNGLILNNQRPHTQNFQRRMYVRELLNNAFRPNQLDFEITGQQIFWEKVNHALVSVCVPGAREDILDRGQLQYMAFGACTISPNLSSDLPWEESLLQNVHYLECACDWSDLVSLIQWAGHNKTHCLKIGENAQALFSRALTDKALFRWIQRCFGNTDNE